MAKNEMEYSPESLLKSSHGKGIQGLRHLAFETSRGLSPEQSFNLSRALYADPDPYGAILATFLAGHVSYVLPEALQFLRGTVPQHPNMVVQDALARSLDHYCLNRGYDRALPILTEWSRDPSEFVRRASVEAPRPWMRKDYFKSNPRAVLSFLDGLKSESNPLVRFSLSNAVGEMVRDHPEFASNNLISSFGAYGPARG
jgi:3-methyladenine DNA glycosylase AlkC